MAGPRRPFLPRIDGRTMKKVLLLILLTVTAFRNVIVRSSPVTAMRWMSLFAAIVSTTIYYKPLSAVNYSALSVSTYAGIAYVVVMSTFCTYLMVLFAQRYLRPTLVSMYNYVQPIVTVLFSVAVGLDTLGFPKAAAALAVFIGVWLVTKSKSRADLEREQKVKN